MGLFYAILRSPIMIIFLLIIFFGILIGVCMPVNKKKNSKDTKSKDAKSDIRLLSFIGWMMIIFGLFTAFFSRDLEVLIMFLLLGVPCILLSAFLSLIPNTKYSTSKSKLEVKVLSTIGLADWDDVPYDDYAIEVSSRITLDKYDETKFLKESGYSITMLRSRYEEKQEIKDMAIQILENGTFDGEKGFKKKVEPKLNELIRKTSYVGIRVVYVTRANNALDEKMLYFNEQKLAKYEEHPELLMSQTEINRMNREKAQMEKVQEKQRIEQEKERAKEELIEKKHSMYDKVNSVIDYANNNKNSLVVKKNIEVVDNLVAKLFDRTVNSIQKIKSLESDEWEIINEYINSISREIKKIVRDSNMVLDYYNSDGFKQLKNTCDELMKTQREFNEYIEEKAQSISHLFGTRVVRNETSIDDEYEYIRPYKKTITPFTADVSSTVFASAENNPLEYVVKYFYPNKEKYEEQIPKLRLLVEELETLKEAKAIIDNYKKEYAQYLGNVPSYVLEMDEKGFYSRLGFATIDENVLVVEYKFSYTSEGGMAQRSFTVPMTEETIVELIGMLESKLSSSSFVKQQRALMTKKLRQQIKERDNFTCCTCGNSTHKEPNLLLEIDHIVPVAKGGLTEESNLQTLCWKCNRSKSDKLL